MDSSVIGNKLDDCNYIPGSFMDRITEDTGISFFQSNSMVKLCEILKIMKEVQ